MSGHCTRNRLIRFSATPPDGVMRSSGNGASSGQTEPPATLEPVIVASDPMLILDAARAGKGVMLAMDASMAPEVEAGRLLRVLPEWIGPQQDLNALFPRERVPSPKLQAFTHYLKTQLRFGDSNRSGKGSV